MKPLSLLARLLGAEGSNFQPTKLIIETLEDPALQNLLTQDDLTGLLKGLGKKHAHSSSTDDLREANLLVKRLIELGGNPWAVEGLVEYWAKNNLPERVDYAFKMKPSEINSPINSWMALAVSANHTRMAVMLLEHGAHINLRGGHYLAHATTPEMVSLLCERVRI